MIASLDTNVLIYTADDGEPEKQALAHDLVTRASREGWMICAQVYGEFYNAAVARRRATRAQAATQIAQWKMLIPAIPSSLEAHARALELATKHQIAYWDALIIATCAEHDITTLFTEDAPSVKKPLGVNCKNPFAKK
jgi:predicted nucleic acid-binding protein